MLCVLLLCCTMTGIMLSLKAYEAACKVGQHVTGHDDCKEHPSADC